MHRVPERMKIGLIDVDGHNFPNNTYMNYELNVDLGRVLGLDKAIENVNQLAEEYNNDFCEWKQEDEEGFSNCRFDYQEIISDEVSGFVYCPYCGKKIKVVE